MSLRECLGGLAGGLSTEFLGRLGWALHALCDGDLKPPGLVLTVPLLFFFFGQLEGRTMDAMLRLLWGWIPVSLCLLHLVRWDWWPGGC